LQEWANSSEYDRIKQGNYQRVGAKGSVEVNAEEAQSEVENLQRQVEQLQQEIDRIKSQRKSGE
jgi:peptidoglycan hydrolase CwlO-like protein